MAYQTIIFEIADAVATLALNRPDKLNAFTGEMHEELRDALAATREGGARVLVITGTGRAFCAGADLGAVDLDSDCSAPGSLDTSLSHAAGLIEIAACHA